MDMKKLAIIDQIESNNIKYFNAVDGDGNFLINFSELKAAFSLLDMNFSEDEVKLLMEDLDTDHDGFISGPEFMNCLRPEYGKTRVLRAFDDLDSDRAGYLSTPQAHQALSSLGLTISLEDSKALAFRRFSGSGDRINLDLFYRMTSYAALFMHRSLSVLLVEGEGPATWKEIVVTIHVIFAALVTIVLGFIRMAPSNNTTMTMVCVILWAGAYVLALRMRGCPRGNKCPRFLPVPYRKIMDCVSLCFGLAALCLLMYYASPHTLLVPLAASAVVGGFLIYMRDW